VLVVPLNFVLSLLIANLVVSKQAKGASVARVIFFIPWLISPIVVGVLWRWLFGENFGLINYVIEKLGGHAIRGSRTRTCRWASW
jgi:alpha-1,4-digalacturonate transport system permease protein